MKKIAIVTVNYNRVQDTLEFLDSLKKLETGDFETKIVCVDNGSSDTSVEEISRKFPDIDLAQTGANLGFAGGFNKGLEYALAWEADYLFLINNDTLINSSQLLSELVKTLESDSKIGVVAPKIYFAPGFEFYKNRYKKEDLGKVIWFAGGSFDWDNINSKHRGIDEVDSGKYDTEEEVDFISGCCFLVKREVFQQIGFFDKDLFAYFEDNDFGQRLKKAGFKKFYNGKVSIFHKVSQTSALGSPMADYFGTRNRLIFGWRYARFRTNFALWREALKFLLFGRQMQKRGVLDFIKQVKGAPGDIIKPSQNPVYPLKLSIVVVNYNTADLTRKLLQSIYAKNSGLDKESSEVILLDNGDIDSCKSFLKDFPEVKFIVNEENTGFTKGYNRAIKYSRGEYVLMLNSDIEVLQGSLSEIIKAAEDHQGRAVLGGRLYFPDMGNQDSCFKLPTIFGAIKEYFLGQKGAYFMFLPKLSGETKVEGMMMACFLIPRKIIDKVGLLDEGTFMFFEDIEYCRRLKRNKVPVYFHPEAKFIHHHEASHKQLKEGEAYKMLVNGSLHYHGRVYYSLLYLVLWLGQKFQKVASKGDALRA